MKSRRMDERIEAFLLDVLQDEGESSRLVCENTRRYLATYEEIFRHEEVYGHKKTRLPRDVAIGVGSGCWTNWINAKARRPQTICGWY